MTVNRERWILTIDLPADVVNSGQVMARVLKHLLRTWGVRCTAIQEGEEEKRLQKIIDGMARRIAEQSELLAMRAE
jgi:hypothetical protein